MTTLESLLHSNAYEAMYTGRRPKSLTWRIANTILMMTLRAMMRVWLRMKTELDA